MSETEQTFQFGDELDRLVERFRQEYDMTYAAIIGTLQIKSHLLCVEAGEDSDE